MKSAPSILLIFLLTYNATFGQAPSVEWQLSSGGSQWDEAHFISKTTDSGYIAVGYTTSLDGDITDPHGDWDVWIIKIDSDGTLQWQKTYGGSSSDNAYSIIDDGTGYVIAGYTYSSDIDVIGNHGLSDVWVFKIDYEGNMVWQKCYGGTSGDYATSIKKTVDGGYIIAARSLSIDGDVTGNHGGGDIWIVKIDEVGVIEWEQCYGGIDLDVSWDIIQSNTGDYLVAGDAFSFDSDICVLRLDSSGALIWEQTFGGTDDEEGYSIVETNDNKILIAGYAESADGDILFNHGARDAWIIEMDSAGNLEAQKTFGGSNYDEFISSNLTTDGNFILAGITLSDDGDLTFNHGAADSWIVLLDSNLVIKWQNTLGGSGYDYGKSIFQTYDGGYISTGSSNSTDGDITGNHGDFDFWTVKMEKPCDQSVYYYDLDSDSFGDSQHYLYSCSDTSGFVINNLDCNDLDGAINPLSVEICNAVDDNCDGISDNGLTFTMYFADADADGYGNAGEDTLACSLVSGFVIDSTDCDDANPFVNPGMPELLNGIDDDCNLVIDDDLIIDNLVANTVWIGPNPAANELIISSNSLNIFKLEIFDLGGRIIYTKNLAKNSCEIDLSTFTPGLYMLKILFENNLVAFRFIDHE